MASNFVKSNKMMRLDSKKSHAWWWDSHISRRNSKWLHDNLEEMDQHVKRMLKLIEEDGDSFAKKAEMYYQKRPELISLVEEFYRMYRSLAERYDHVTGELRKNIPSDLQSQGSGISDVGSEPPSSIPSPDQRPSRRKTGPRAAGFNFFLGSNGSASDLNSKEGDESSTLDSESESDDSSVNNYSATHINDENQMLRRKIVELEVELREVKEKLQLQEVEDISEISFGKQSDEYSEFSSRIAKYEDELRVAKQKIQISEEEITSLTNELQRYKYMGEDVVMQKDLNGLESSTQLERNQARELQESIDSEPEGLDSVHKIQKLKEELKIGQEKLHESEKEFANLKQELTSKNSSFQDLQDQLKSAQREVTTWKNKFEKEKREVSRVLDRIVRYKMNLSDREQEIRGLKEAMSNANKSLSEENEQLKSETTRLLKEQAYLEDNLKELDLRCQYLEEELRRAKAEKEEAEVIFQGQIEKLKADISEKNESIGELTKNLESLHAEKADLCIKISELSAEMSSKDDRIDQMSKHLHQLHTEHMELIAGAEGARKIAEELSSKINVLEKEVEKKEKVIREGADEKREAIRQLCFSLEHYRNGYHRLRQVVVGNKNMIATAS